LIILLLAVGAVLLLSGTAFSITRSAANAVMPTAPVQQSKGQTAVNISDQSLTGSFITENPTTWPGSSFAYANDKVWNICTAVALAEGFNLGAGAAPFDLNNPGDLSPGDEAGQPTAGPAQSHGGSNIIYFKTSEGGFVALYHKFNNIVNGDSSVYPVDWTWNQVASRYAGNSQSWLNNVTAYLGVDPETTPEQYVNS
jgi:hypothetical protein